jgi:hypothetical protein
MEDSKINNEALKSVLDDNISTSLEGKWLIQYHKDYKVSKNINVVEFGKVDELAYDTESGEAIVKPVNTVDEFTFYYLFCTINNIIAKKAIADTQLLVLSAIMSRPLDFSLPIDSKDGKLTDIANELSTDKKVRTPNAIYQSVKRLRDKGYLVEVEDRLIVPNAHFQRVRQIVKNQIAKKGFATFDYLFKCFISNDNG